MNGSLDKPQRVGLDGVFVTRDFLLFETPLGEFDLVREEIATSQRMAQPKRRPQCPQLLGRFLVTFISMLDFHEPVVVCVSSKSWHAIR